MNVYLNLIFGTTEGRLHTMRIPHAVDQTIATPIKNSMNKLIESGCIRTGRGDLSSREGARLVRVTSRRFDVK